MTLKTAKKLSLGVAIAALCAGSAVAQDFGSFSGYTLRVKLIGGA